MEDFYSQQMGRDWHEYSKELELTYSRWYEPNPVFLVHRKSCASSSCEWYAILEANLILFLDMKFIPIVQQQLDSKIFGVTLGDLAKGAVNFSEGVPIPVLSAVEYLLTDSKYNLGRPVDIL